MEGRVHCRLPSQKTGAILQGGKTSEDRAAPGKEAAVTHIRWERAMLWHLGGGRGTLFLSVLTQHYKMVLFWLILSWSQHNLAYWCSEKLFTF